MAHHTHTLSSMAPSYPYIEEYTHHTYVYILILYHTTKYKARAAIEFFLEVRDELREKQSA